MTTEITKIINGFKEFSEEPYQDSINFLRDYIEVEPSSEAYFELGKALFFTEDYDESIRYLKMSDDERSDAYLGLDHYRKKDYPTAIRHFAKFLNSKENESILTYLMLSYEKCSHWKDAIDCGEKILEISPENFSVMVSLIDYHMNVREYEMSLEYLNELKTVEKCRYKRGLVLYELKRYEEAIDELKSVKSVKAYKLISKAYERLEKPTKAVRYLYKAHELDGNIETLFEISDFLTNSQEYEKSIHVLKRILESEPDNERALEGIAGGYSEIRKYHHAITYCEALLEINSENVRAYEILADAHFFLHDLEKTSETIEKGLEIDSKSAELWNMKAWVDYSMNDFEEYVRDFEHLIRLKPNTIAYYIILIRECYLQNQPERSRKYYDRLMLYNPAFKMSFEEATGENPSWNSLCPYP